MCDYDYTVDFLILGTGSAGSVLANILSEDHRNSVIAIEAGQNSDSDPYIIDAANAAQIESAKYVEYFWQGDTLADPDAANQVFQWTGGRILGGGSSVNGVLYMRGSTELFDNYWAHSLDLNGQLNPFMRHIKK